MVAEEVHGNKWLQPLTSDEEELTQCFEMCDGLLLTGGHDVDPRVYHEFLPVP